jgi:hypothetical protein
MTKTFWPTGSLTVRTGRTTMSPGDTRDEPAVEVFSHEVEEYRISSGRMHPTWSDVLKVARSLPSRPSVQAF